MQILYTTAAISIPCTTIIHLAHVPVNSGVASYVAIVIKLLFINTFEVWDMVYALVCVCVCVCVCVGKRLRSWLVGQQDYTKTRECMDGACALAQNKPHRFLVPIQIKGPTQDFFFTLSLTLWDRAFFQLFFFSSGNNEWIFMKNLVYSDGLYL